VSRQDPKEEIFRAASVLFSKKGYHGTTIREIAEARGILSGSLYAHIESKEDLLFQIVDEGANAFIHALEPILNQSSDPIQKIRDGIAAHIRVITDHLHSAKVFLHEWTALRDERRKIIKDKRDYYEQMWTQLLQEGVEQGVIQPADIPFMRTLILSVANWVYQWYNPAGAVGPEQIAERFSQFILYGIATSKETHI
jgi:AcrR family transcriptional regulator